MTEISLIIKPDEEDLEAAEVYVDGTIGGNPYRFLLDTGAGRSSVIADAYTVTFESVDKSNSSGVFAKSSEDLITVPNIQVGPVSVENLTIVRAPKEVPQIRNLIGMDILKEFSCHFLFDQNRVQIDPDQATEADYAFQELFLDQRFHPYVEVQFETAKGNAVWDTGASITIVDLNFVKKHPAYFQEAGHSVGTDSTGLQMETPMFTMATSLIGNNTFPPHKVAGVDLAQVNSTIEVPMDLILGYSTLSKANWWFDFPGKKWAISKLLV